MANWRCCGAPRDMATGRGHLEQTRRLLERLAERDPEAPVYRVELTRTLNRLALVDLTTYPERSREALERAIAIDRGLLATNPNEAIAIRADLGRMHNHLGMLHKAADRPERAEACYQEAITILEALAGEQPDEAIYRVNLASAHYNLGNLRCQTGRPGALASLERARGPHEELLRQRPANSAYRGDLARTLGTIAVFQRFSHRLDQARAGFERVRDLFEELARDDPTVPRHRRELITTYDNLALLWAEGNRPENVVACLQRTQTLLEGLLQENPADQGLKRELAAVSCRLANVARELGRDREALNALPDDVFAH